MTSVLQRGDRRERRLGALVAVRPVRVEAVEPAGPSRSMVMAVVTTAITRRSMTPIAKRMDIRSALQ